MNVSAVLKNLGYDSVALGFVAGFTGREIEAGAKLLGFETDFIQVEKGMSRINVKLKSNEETEINGMGPEITAKDVEKLFDKLMKLQSGDVLVLSGSIPKSIDEHIYERIMEKLSDRDIQIVVDATKDLLLNVLKYKPFLIKPNNHELGEMFGVKLTSAEDITKHAKKLQEWGAKNVLISMAKDGAILVDENGTVSQIGVPKGEVKNSVGAGDSMVAGFLAGYMEKKDFAYALKLGTATGSASAFSEGLAAKDKVMELLQQL